MTFEGCREVHFIDHFYSTIINILPYVSV